ncbi:MAG TPA: Gfo/Idh/MocA family oxidoreductase [Rhizomicrobium sp.]
MKTIRLGLLGVGKIARDQHIPVLRASAEFTLAAVASRHSAVDSTPSFHDLSQMLDGAEIDAVAICTPPQNHFEAARTCLARGKHVLLEKPPCASTTELDILAAEAARQRLTLLQSWHSRFAPGVALAAEILRGRKLRRATVIWKEDVRRWHPGQSWIWEAGGFGVFDPGINALSILTAVVTDEIFLRDATLHVPTNCQTPIAAELSLSTVGGAEIAAEFDFRHTGTQTWDIALETDQGPVLLQQGGSVVAVDGKTLDTPHDAHHPEYTPLYRRFAELVRAGRSDVDARPFRLVADAFLMGRRLAVEPFHE